MGNKNSVLGQHIENSGKTKFSIFTGCGTERGYEKTAYLKFIESNDSHLLPSYLASFRLELDKNERLQIDNFFFSRIRKICGYDTINLENHDSSRIFIEFVLNFDIKNQNDLDLIFIYLQKTLNVLCYENNKDEIVKCKEIVYDKLNKKDDSFWKTINDKHIFNNNDIYDEISVMCDDVSIGIYIGVYKEDHNTNFTKFLIGLLFSKKNHIRRLVPFLIKKWEEFFNTSSYISL